jgi:ABC-type transport system involved in Fe-S cluster assembly fused permease/ATPase subunit
MREAGYDATRVRERTGHVPRSAERGLRDLAHVQRQILHQLPPQIPGYRLDSTWLTDQPISQPAIITISSILLPALVSLLATEAGMDQLRVYSW